jgi:hypothetical protein
MPMLCLAGTYRILATEPDAFDPHMVHKAPR